MHHKVRIKNILDDKRGGHWTPLTWAKCWASICKLGNNEDQRIVFLTACHQSRVVNVLGTLLVLQKYKSSCILLYDLYLDNCKLFPHKLN